MTEDDAGAPGAGEATGGEDAATAGGEGAATVGGEGATIRVEVPALLHGVRIDRAVALLTGLSRSAATAMVAEGRVKVGGRAISTGSRPLAEREVLEVGPMPGAAPGVVAEPDVEVQVVHADAEVLVVDKPAGLVVHPGAGHYHHTLIGGLLARFPDLAELSRSGVCDPMRPGIVQRLDRGTSGLLVVARTERAYRSLVAQLAERSVERRYLALVRGHVADDRGIVEAPIGRSVRSPTRMAVSAQGKAARTRYVVLGRYEEPAPCSLLLLALDTGRTHQIRVHLSAIGYPVVGDDRYGSVRTDPVGFDLPPGRLFLHACRLGFDHPGTGERVHWASALPAELANVVPGLPELTDEVHRTAALP
jgi:23S rRNA pseudouridine1911/1915/1917 synthase